MASSSSTDIDGLEQLMEELVVICQSKDLSIEYLQAKVVELIPSQTLPSSAYVHLYSSRPFFHAACMNENVTVEIIECLLDAFPLVQNSHTGKFCPEETTTSYALHCACYNNNCPNEVIKLLVKNNSVALNHFCLVGEGINCGDVYYGDDYIRGLPLHYYLARKNVDIVTVKILVEACPQTSLMTFGDMSLPLIHVAVCNNNINIDDLRDIIIFFLGQEQSSQIIRMLDRWNATPLNRVCMNQEGLTLEVFQLVFDASPGAIRLGDIGAKLPIHWLCCNDQMDDSASLDILRFMLNIDPTLIMETDECGYLPVHWAVTWKSYAFCKALIDAYPESVRIGIGSNHGSLPIHEACEYGSRDDTVDTIQYLLELHPESLHVRNELSRLPIHDAAAGGNTKTIELLQMHDPTAASKETTDERRELPLHIACDSYKEHVDAVKALFDIYPEAILTRNRNGKTPIDLARERVALFLEAQLEYARKAQNMTTMTTLDENSLLPLHRALKDNVPLGSIKLLVRGNPSAVRTVDDKLAFPLHLACEFSSVKVVQYLLEIDERFIRHCDDNKDSIFHHACRGGNLGVVKYLLEEHAHLVSSATVNDKGELPIHLLCESRRGEGYDDIESTEYIETIWLLLLANPEVVMA